VRICCKKVDERYFYGITLETVTANAGESKGLE